MRYFEIISESNIPNVDPGFIKAVRKRLKTGQQFGDYQAPAQDADLDQAIHQALKQIDYMAGIGATMTVYREELRPKVDIKNPGTLGIYWCWHAASAKAYYGQEFAADIHGKQKLTTVCYEATVASKDIDWVSTVVANLAMSDEREITLRDGAVVTLVVAYVGNKEIPLKGLAHISNIGRYDNI